MKSFFWHEWAWIRPHITSVWASRDTQKLYIHRRQFSYWMPLLKILSTWFLSPFSFWAPKTQLSSCHTGECKQEFLWTFRFSKIRAEQQNAEPGHPAFKMHPNFARSKKTRGRQHWVWNQAQIFHYYINETIHRWHILSCLDVFHWIQRLISSTGLSLYSFTLVLSHAAGNGRLTRLRSGCCRGRIRDKNKNINEMGLKDSRTFCC